MLFVFSILRMSHASLSRFTRSVSLKAVSRSETEPQHQLPMPLPVNAAALLNIPVTLCSASVVTQCDMSASNLGASLGAALAKTVLVIQLLTVTTSETYWLSAEKFST